MPLCYCFTNQSLDSLPANFETNLTDCVAEVLNKPIEKVAIILNQGRVCMAGSNDPAFIMQINSIDRFDEKRNPAYFQKFFDFLKDKLGLPEKRLRILFVDIEDHMVRAGK